MKKKIRESIEDAYYTKQTRLEDVVC